ncbi:MAG: LuxR C-terminal-related transcriptional regulator [Coriobacteriia bacterium]|nr:LuxR C-terminal-related transcriptional regulator [Coriobacteriia bacterium]
MAGTDFTDEPETRVNQALTKSAYIFMRKRLGIMAPFLVMVLLGLVLLFIFQTGHGVKSDSLYRDLTASPIYAKLGFQPSYAQTTDPGSLHWDLIRPPHGGPIIMSNLPEPKTYTHYGPFSIAQRDIKEFTILIPFNLDQSAVRRLQSGNPVYPALHFAGIGENWEVFVNGHSVARQIFVDSTGHIIQFRNVRNVAIPVEREYLHEGENFLVIHILGAYSSKWTGLRYSAPYYLGNSSFTYSNFTGISSMVLCAVFMLIALYHLLTYAFGKTDRYNLLFLGFTIIASLYYFTEAQIIYTLLPNTIFNQLLNYALMYVLIFLGVAFLETTFKGKVSKITAAFGIVSATLAVVQWCFPVWFAYDLVDYWRYLTILYIAYAIIADLLWLIYKGIVDLRKSSDPKRGLWQSTYHYLFKTEFGIITLMLMIVGLTVIIDISSISLFSTILSLKSYSLLGFTMSMAYILARRYSSGYENALRESIASNEQNLTEAGLSNREMDVALLLIEGSTRHDIARKLHLSSAEINQDITAIREKVIRKSDDDPTVTLAALHYGLTRRETDVLRCLRRSMTNKEIATELVVSEETVKSHVRTLMKKLPVKNRREITTWTMDQ